MTGAEAASVILRAEREIRGQIAEAAAAGAYALVDRLSGIARRLAELASEATSASEVPDGRTPIVKAAEERTFIAAPSLRTGRNVSGKLDYPRFERSRDALVKIGWSKKGRDEYAHKAPKLGIDAVARRMMDLGKNRQVFTTDDLLPVKLDGGQEELPGYQAYVCLAWLRKIGAVEQHGREGYSVCDNDFMDKIRRCWDALPISRR